MPLPSCRRRRGGTAARAAPRHHLRKPRIPRASTLALWLTAPHPLRHVLQGLRVCMTPEQACSAARSPAAVRGSSAGAAADEPRACQVPGCRASLSPGYHWVRCASGDAGCCPRGATELCPSPHIDR